MKKLARTARDMESRVNDTHHQALKLWLRLLSCTTRVEGVIRDRLRREFATTLPRFDLLAQLEREPDGLPMGELSQRLMVTGANVTGITDQLEAEGLVRRSVHPSDRRSYAVQLTRNGRRQFRRMAAVHEQWVVELFAGWGGKQQDQMYALLAGLKKHLATVNGRTLKRRKPGDRVKESAA
ncbi:MAG TPA: MarR family transcriptional regulator [Vicinamibacterales bacterium]|nr:MarR family transcriptional regulator [Vicinamibacterales bacterium]